MSIPDDVRHKMELYVKIDKDSETKYMNVFFPDLGNMTITYETRIGNTEKRPVISVDFDVEKIDVIDAYGGDREIT